VSRVVRRAVAVAAALALGAGPAAGPVGSAAAAPARERWDTRVFARVQAPGYPAYVHVHSNGQVYAGTFTDPRGDRQASVVREWSPEGTLLRSWRVRGQRLEEPHGVQVAQQTSRGELVLLERSTSSLRLLDPRTGRQRRISRFPDLPTCVPPTTPAPGCSPNVLDLPAIPNYATWGPGGALLVSDYGQAVIWRVPPRGGRPRVWFSSPALDGTHFGTTGLVHRPGSRDLLVAQQSTAADGTPPTHGKLYRLPITDRGRPGRLRTLWTSQPTELPDGFGVGRSGRIYLANAGPSAQLVVLSRRGRELERFPRVPLTGDNGSPIPFDTPSNATFLDTRVLVANQSFTGDGGHHAILDVEVGEPGLAPHLPPGAFFR
jgi:hypothetical protein